MGIVNPKNVGANLKTVAVGTGSATAGGTGDDTAVTGATIDRAGFLSAVFGLVITATLTAAKDCTVAVGIQESADGTNWDDEVALRAAASPFTAAQVAAGGAQLACVEIDVDLSGRKRYVRFNPKPNLSHTGTDTCIFGAVAVLGGSENIPV
jgi:hypothetical protein